MTKKYLAISIFLLILLALSYGISRIFKSTPPQSKPPTPPKQNQQSSPSGKTPEPQIIVPEGWKVYENRGLGFNVWYPGDWFVQGEGKGGLEISTVRDFDLVLGNLVKQGADIRFGARPNFSYSTLQEAKKNHSGLIIWDEYDTRADYVKETKFKGIFAIERAGKPIALSEPGYSLEINFIKNKTLYHFMLFAMTKEEVLRYEPVFRQMLETFSFRNDSVPEGWNTYEDKEFGFRVSHPAGWYEQEIARDGNGKVAAKSFTTAKEIGPLLGGMSNQDLMVTVHVTLDFPYKTLEEAKSNHSGLIYWQDYDPRAEYVKQIYFKNMPAVERMGLNPAETKDYYLLTIEFIKGNRLYLLKLLCLTKEALLNHEQTFRKVLETFDFIE